MCTQYMNNKSAQSLSFSEYKTWMSKISLQSNSIRIKLHGLE